MISRSFLMSAEEAMLSKATQKQLIETCLEQKRKDMKNVEV
jgi:hypothetical protein